MVRHTRRPMPAGRVSLRVQVPNNHILTQNLYYNYYYPNPKYLIIGYMDPLGMIILGINSPEPFPVLQSLVPVLCQAKSPQALHKRSTYPYGGQVGPKGVQM